MGKEQSTGSERENYEVSGVRKKNLFPGARGECLENAPDGVNLHLGCGGKRWNGFINVDIVGGDVVSDLKKLPFDDNYADLAVSIHVLEHFYYWEVIPLLNEWKRVLKSNGTLVLELPCMNKVFNHISDSIRLQQPMNAQKSWLALWGDPREQRPEMCHRWGWTKEDLTDTLTECGFKDITHEQPRYHMASRDMRIVCRKA